MSRLCSIITKNLENCGSSVAWENKQSKKYYCHAHKKIGHIHTKTGEICTARHMLINKVSQRNVIFGSSSYDFNSEDDDNDVDACDDDLNLKTFLKRKRPDIDYNADINYDDEQKKLFKRKKFDIFKYYYDYDYDYDPYLFDVVSDNLNSDSDNWYQSLNDIDSDDNENQNSDCDSNDSHLLDNEYEFIQDKTTILQTN